MILVINRFTVTKSYHYLRFICRLLGASVNTQSMCVCNPNFELLINARVTNFHTIALFFCKPYLLILFRFMLHNMYHNLFLK